MTQYLTVYGEPVGWQRAGRNKITGATYTQKKTLDREKLIAETYAAKCGYFFPEKTPIYILTVAFFPIPKSTTKKKMAEIIAGRILPTVKPDRDNIGKLVSDALNGTAYADDKDIVIGCEAKKYTEDRPRTVIVITDDKKDFKEAVKLL